MREMPVIGANRPMFWAPASKRRDLWKPAGKGIGRRKISLGLDIDVDAIPTSILFGVAGGIVAYLAGIFEGAPKIIVRSVGFIGIGYAIYNLLKKEKKAEEPKPAPIPQTVPAPMPILETVP